MTKLKLLFTLLSFSFLKTQYMKMHKLRLKTSKTTKYIFIKLKIKMLSKSVTEPFL